VTNQEFDFETLCIRLVDGGVNFVVAGGVACALNGYVRTTEDLDILVDGATDNIRNLLDIFTLLQNKTFADIVHDIRKNTKGSTWQLPPITMMF
jgi:hypothetical protein